MRAAVRVAVFVTLFLAARADVVCVTVNDFQAASELGVVGHGFVGLGKAGLQDFLAQAGLTAGFGSLASRSKNPSKKAGSVSTIPTEEELASHSMYRYDDNSYVYKGVHDHIVSYSCGPIGSKEVTVSCYLPGKKSHAGEKEAIKYANVCQVQNWSAKWGRPAVSAATKTFLELHHDRLDTFFPVTDSSSKNNLKDFVTYKCKRAMVARELLNVLQSSFKEHVKTSDSCEVGRAVSEFIARTSSNLDYCFLNSVVEANKKMDLFTVFRGVSGAVGLINPIAGAVVRSIIELVRFLNEVRLQQDDDFSELNFSIVGLRVLRMMRLIQPEVNQDCANKVQYDGTEDAVNAVVEKTERELGQLRSNTRKDRKIGQRVEDFAGGHVGYTGLLKALGLSSSS